MLEDNPAAIDVLANDGDGDTLAISDVYHQSQAGRYYVRVYPFSGNSDTESYSLKAMYE